jgi:hypothetical protein
VHRRRGLVRTTSCSPIGQHVLGLPRSFVTSTCWKNASPHSVAVRSPCSATTSATHTRAPSAAKRRAASRPIPPAAPVMTQTLPSSRPLIGGDPDEGFHRVRSL